MATRKITIYANGATVYENGVAGTATSVGIFSFPVYAPDPSSFTASTDGWGIETKTVSFEKNGYVFSEWNTAADGTGTSFQIGDLIANSASSYQARAVYAIWKLPPVTYTTDSDELTSIADAIRAKGGTSAALVYPTGFVSAINDISAGGGTKTVSISLAPFDLIWVDGDGTAHVEHWSSMQWPTRVCLSGSLIIFTYDTLQPGEELAVSNAHSVTTINADLKICVYQVD